MTSSLTTALEEITINNEQLKREVDVLKTDITQLRSDNDGMKDESKQLKANIDKQRDEIGDVKAENVIIKDEGKQLITLLDKMAVNNENQMQQINSQSSEIVLLRTEVQQLKVSHWSGIT